MQEEGGGRVPKIEITRTIAELIMPRGPCSGAAGTTKREKMTVPHSSVKCESLFPQEFSPEKALWVVARSTFRCFHLDVFFKARVALFQRVLYHHINKKINRLDKNPWKTEALATVHSRRRRSV